MDKTSKNANISQEENMRLGATEGWAPLAPHAPPAVNSSGYIQCIGITYKYRIIMNVCSISKASCQTYIGHDDAHRTSRDARSLGLI